MLRDALGARPSPEQYRAALALLYEHMSDRNLADAASEAFGVASERALNDVYEVASRRDPAPEAREVVLRALVACGFAAWVGTNDPSSDPGRDR
jgi:hypothetical protein